MLNVLIVTVAYNPPTTILKNLEVDYYPHLVIDNSEQETVWLKEYCLLHNHIYQWMGGNVGIAKALNVGAEYAIDNDYEYIVTMDQDSKLTNVLLDKMGQAIENYNMISVVAVFSPRHVDSYNTSNVTQSETTNNFFAMSSGNFLNLSIWHKLGGFNEELFIDMVDVEYYVRALINNYQVITFQKIGISHSIGNESCIHWVGKYGFDVWNHGKIRKYYQARNFWYVYKKYHQQMPELIFIKKIIRKMPISIILFEKNKLGKLYYYLRGYIDYLRGKLGKIDF